MTTHDSRETDPLVAGQLPGDGAGRPAADVTTAPARLDEPRWVDDGGPTDATTSTDTPVGADWSRLAGDFVDDPQRAVADARSLVQDAVDRMMAQAGVGPDGAAHDGPGETEALRLAFRRLRDLHRSVTTL